MNCKKILIFTGSLIIISLCNFALAADFFVSWQTDTYAPYFYQGKVLPTNDSNVIASFELLDNGRSVDVSKKTVRWYLDNELLQSGAGLRTIVFKTNALKRDAQQLRIVLPQYENSKDLEKLLFIPITSPEVVIDAPYANGLLPARNALRSEAGGPAGTNLLRGLFYFFNIRSLKDLTLDWFVNSQPAPSSPLGSDILELPTPILKGDINIGLSAKNKNNEMEFGSEKISLMSK